MRRYLIYILLLVTWQVSGQDIRVEAEYPEVVTSGEQFAVTWKVNASGGEFSAPAFTGFYKLIGPQTSYSSSTQIINGKFSQQTSYSYTYYLQAINEGKFVLGPATIRIKNKDYRSDSIRIEVIGEQTGQSSRQNVSPGENITQDDQLPSSDLFVRLNLNRSDVYIGEHIVASVKIYTRMDLGGLNEVKYPDFKGFYKEDLETQPLTSLQRENINGTIYGTGVVQQFLLFPQITGEITIDPVEITALIQQRVGQSDPFFGDFFASYRNVPKVIVSQPLKVNVKPLPGARPPDFSGIVGNITLSASLNKDSVNVNDALNFKITVSGSGNLKLAGLPVLKLSPDIEVYDPRITDNVRNSASGSSGQKTFEFVLIPRHYGEYTIPPVTYTFFNTATKKYETLTTREFRFYARRVTDQSGGYAVFEGVSKEDVKYLGKDIRFIKSTSGKLNRYDMVLVSGKYFYTIYGFALLLFLIILFIRREHIRRNADISAVRNRKAGKIAGKRLHEASKCLKSGLTDKFHEEILKALWGYISDKLNIPVSELTRSRALEMLKAKGISEEEINKLVSMLDRCEYARYAPASSGAEASDIYRGAAQFIKYVENNL